MPLTRQKGSAMPAATLARPATFTCQAGTCSKPGHVATDMKWPPNITIAPTVMSFWISVCFFHMIEPPRSAGAPHQGDGESNRFPVGFRWLTSIQILTLNYGFVLQVGRLLSKVLRLLNSVSRESYLTGPLNA